MVLVVDGGSEPGSGSVISTVGGVLGSRLGRLEAGVLNRNSESG